MVNQEQHDPEVSSHEVKRLQKELQARMDINMKLMNHISVLEKTLKERDNYISEQSAMLDKTHARELKFLEELMSAQAKLSELKATIYFTEELIKEEINGKD